MPFDLKFYPKTTIAERDHQIIELDDHTHDTNANSQSGQ